MAEIPAEICERRDGYCDARGIGVEGLRGYGFDGFVWQTTVDTIVKVFRHDGDFQRELAVYQRLQIHQIEQLQGFHIPILLHYDVDLFVLELSFVRPPYILDFAAATLDVPPPGFDTEDQDWIAEKHRVFGSHWPAIVRLLDALRHVGIHYCDVHRENIRTVP
jgi:hypothetical protein